METFGDVLMIAEAVRPGNGPAAEWYASRWERPAPERIHPWRLRIALALHRAARALTPPEAVAPGRREQTYADGAAS